MTGMAQFPVSVAVRYGDQLLVAKVTEQWTGVLNVTCVGPGDITWQRVLVNDDGLRQGSRLNEDGIRFVESFLRCTWDLHQSIMDHRPALERLLRKCATRCYIRGINNLGTIPVTVPPDVPLDSWFQMEGMLAFARMAQERFSLPISDHVLSHYFGLACQEVAKAFRQEIERIESSIASANNRTRSRVFSAPSRPYLKA